MNVSSPDLIEDATIYIKKYNRTFDALNSTATFKQWLNDSIFVCQSNLHLLHSVEKC